MPLHRYIKPKIREGHIASVYGLTTDHHQNVYAADGAGMLVQWQADQEQGILLAKGDASWYACAYLEQNQMLVAGNMHGEIIWFDLNQKQIAAQNLAHQKGVFGFLPIQTGCLSLGGDGVLHIWEGFQCAESIKLSERSLRTGSQSPNNAYLAIGSSDGSIYIREGESLQAVCTIEKAHEPSVFAVCFSPCGQYLLSGGRDAVLRIWSVPDGFRLVEEISAHLYTINDICYSEAGQHFFTASRDRTIKIWDAQTFALLKVLDAAKYSVHTASVNRLAVLGNQLWSCSDDKRIVEWGSDQLNFRD